MNVDAYWRRCLASLPVSNVDTIVTMRELTCSQPTTTKKDPRSSSSLLTRCESDRFQAALYRGDCSSLEAYLVRCGPRATLQAFRGGLTGMDRKVVPVLRTSYEQFYEVFNMAESLKQPGDGVLIFPYECILSKLKCTLSPTMRAPLEGLWSESNWSYLRGVVPPSEFLNFVELPWWNSYTDADVLGDICHSTSYSQLIGEVFLLRSKAYRTWKPGYWLCTPCLQTFMRDNIEAFCRSREYPEQ
ncbi:hypothetical protein L210DRAFT_3535404 [Boletus edulis BED1]|uniref:Uncharacterized protein n=1 Tax=Boletus edulis BED1 TaxID=1328754 RepID=A0AAD4BZ99_BOLED|nr:hypothetical protein L210DRAFT_3535404 [Boletus edulis BED1]